MKSLFAAIAFLAVAQAQALTLNPGETTRINGTVVTCSNTSTTSKCEMRPSHYCSSAEVKIFINGVALGQCLDLETAVNQLGKLGQAGLCF